MKNSILTAVLAAALLACAAARAVQEETRYFYDDAGRLATAAWSVGASNAAAHYRYDANGNRTGTLHVAANDLSVDSNGDGMPDLGPLAYCGTLAVDGAADPDGDGLVNSNEFALLGNPFAADTDGDGRSDPDESVAGTLLYDPASLFCIDALSLVPGQGLRVGWNVCAGRTYQFQSSTGQLAAWITNFVFASTNDGTYATNQPLAEPRFFRTRVRMTE